MKTDTVYDETNSVTKEHITKVIQGLSERISEGEIYEICVPLVAYLQQMTNERLDADRLNFLVQVEQFLEKEISASDLNTRWQAISSQSERTKGLESPNYEALGARLNKGEIIPFFGSEFLQLFNPRPPASPTFSR